MIKLVRNRTIFLAGVALLAALVFVALYSGLAASYSPTTGPVTIEPQTTSATPASEAIGAAATTSATPAAVHAAIAAAPPTVSIDGQRVNVTLALTSAQQEKGLGGRTSLGSHEGMLFVFPFDDQHMFWMKDMNFSIDMIWFSSDGTVIYIQPDVSPATYPEAFGPQEPSRYVLEVPANFASRYGIKVGGRAILPLL